ncbi:MAG: prolyl oligopeptidase family serine peptidase [Planctomycetota bacterium]
MTADHARRPFQADDLFDLHLIPDADFAVDGSLLVWSQTRAHRETMKLHSDLWICRLAAGEKPRQFTGGDWSDSMPRLSPDGRTIAFVSNRLDEKQPRVWLMPTDGGEPRQLTQDDGTTTSLRWTPDGKSLLATFRAKDAAVIERESDEQAKKLGIVCRHITRVHYKEDGVGWLPENRVDLVRIDVATGKQHVLVAGKDRDIADVAVSPDGKHVAWVVCEEPDADMEPSRQVIRLLDLTVPGAKPHNLKSQPVGPKSALVFSPDSAHLAWLGEEGLRRVADHTNLWVAPIDDSAPAQNLTGSHDILMWPATINDTAGLPAPARPVWAPEGRFVFVQSSRHGRTSLVKVDTTNASAAPVPIVEGDFSVNGFWFSADHAQLVTLELGMCNPGTLRLRDMPGGNARDIACAAGDLLSAVKLSPPEEVWFTAADGHKLQGWIQRPPDFDASKQYPCILQIHGGPLVQYGHAMMAEFHWLAAQGYVVGYSNPRGGMGYGETHAQAILHNWGTTDYDDVMTFADQLAALPYVDTRRMGVAGGSYGGFMTNWIIARSKRFAAAVSMRCVSNFTSFVGSSDFNWHFRTIFAADAAPWDSPEALAQYWRQSPISELAKATTPTLVIHSEQDHRCPLEQGEQVFVALKMAGVQTEMVVFPDESHGLSRGGRTDRRIARLGHIGRWFDMFLKA